jgi:hypothetical protein
MDGKPLPKVMVTFAPIGTKENTAPGPTAAGPTNAEGRYSLKIMPHKPGAVVGACRIYITTEFDDRIGGSEDKYDGAPGPGPARRVPKEPIPAKYNSKTELTYEVPAGGTDRADFDLKSK